MSISHPDSAEYGKILGADEVTDLFAPSDESLEAVYAWLRETGVPSTAIAHSDNKGWLATEMTAAHVENLFSSELYEFEHPKSGKACIEKQRQRITDQRVVSVAFPKVSYDSLHLTVRPAYWL